VVSETITSWRITSPGFTWAANALSGNGAARHPGRWNSRDRPILYSSSSIALACLETVVHLAGDDPLPFQRQLVRITIPSPHWRERKIFVQEERGGWDLPPNPETVEDWLSATRAWGDAWLVSLESLIAEVPSVIVPEESNLLLNPRHPALGEVVAEIVRPWVYDARLLPTTQAGTLQAGPPWQEPLGAGVVLEIFKSPEAMTSFLTMMKASGAKSVTVKIPKDEYSGKKYSISIFGFELACTVEEEQYVTLTFNFKQ
jgi:RES domain-containing protein